MTLFEQPSNNSNKRRKNRFFRNKRKLSPSDYGLLTKQLARLCEIPLSSNMESLAGTISPNATAAITTSESASELISEQINFSKLF